jgi:hypothetical protein
VHRLSSPVSPPKLRMTGANLSQAYGATIKLFHHSQQGSKALQEVGKVVAPTEGQGHEEGASLGARSIRGDLPRFLHHFRQRSHYW